MEIQDHLLTWYKFDFNHADWHGYLSFQRIVWQDPKVLKFLKKPGATTLLLSAHKSQALKTLEQSHATVAGLLFGGFSGMLPLFLFTVRPNFHMMLPGLTVRYVDSLGSFTASSSCKRGFFTI